MLPRIVNEVMRNYAPKSAERLALQQAISNLKPPYAIPLANSMKFVSQVVPANHKQTLAHLYLADSKQMVEEAIKRAMEVKPAWESMPFQSRAAIFLKAAELLSSTEWRYKVMAATCLGQGKNAWQAEIDAAAELTDFLRYNCLFAERIMAEPLVEAHAPGSWNRVDWRPLEGFVMAITPFNFTAIAGNLPCAPALMGNTVIWKCSPSAALSNWFLMELLKEAGLPEGVIQWLPMEAPSPFLDQILTDPHLAGVHFTGSTAAFHSIWSTIGMNISKYRTFPRLVGETGGKNAHLLHESANLQNAVQQSLRAAFEYAGQKCSACSRLYVPRSLWPHLNEMLIAETSTLSMGGDLTDFVGPVINRTAFDRLSGYLERAKQNKDKVKILTGGQVDDSQGYFIHPTILLANEPDYETLVDELFGPILTVYLYDDWIEILSHLDTSKYALTLGIFAQDRTIIDEAINQLRHSAGNVYINDKCTGAVVGQQAFGGSRLSGTNDKAGSHLNLLRWCSPRIIKENFIPLDKWIYPSNLK